MQNAPEVGKLIVEGTPAFRDAIHVAVAPVLAGMRMKAGDSVGLNAKGEAVFSDHPVGLVDPYLCRDVCWVEVGQRFWLFLFPNTVTSLRHAWMHPAFTSRPPARETSADA